MHVGQPILAERGRWADPRVAESATVTQGMHVRAILFDPCAYLISSANGPVTRDDDIDVARHALDQPQRGKVVLDRVSGVQAEHRNQDIRKHVAGDENAALLDQQRRMARGMRLMLDNPDLGTVPRNPCSFSGQPGNAAEHVVQWYLFGDVGRKHPGNAGFPTCVRQHTSDSSRAAGRTVTGRCAEPGVPQQVVPVRMRREARYNGLARICQVVCEAEHFGAPYPGVDKQHAGASLHDNGVALAEVALMDQYTFRDLPQHEASSACGDLHKASLRSRADILSNGVS